MYSKCGNVAVYAEKVFNSSFERDTVVYKTSSIDGRASYVLTLVKPDDKVMWVPMESLVFIHFILSFFFLDNYSFHSLMVSLTCFRVEVNCSLYVSILQSLLLIFIFVLFCWRNQATQVQCSQGNNIISTQNSNRNQHKNNGLMKKIKAQSATFQKKTSLSKFP